MHINENSSRCSVALQPNDTGESHISEHRLHNSPKGSPRKSIKAIGPHGDDDFDVSAYTACVQRRPSAALSGRLSLAPLSIKNLASTSIGPMHRSTGVRASHAPKQTTTSQRNQCCLCIVGFDVVGAMPFFIYRGSKLVKV